MIIDNGDETWLMIKMVIMMVIVIYNRGVMAMNGGMKSIMTRMMTKIVTMIVTMMLIITGSMKNIMMITKITSLTGMMPIISDMVTRMTLMTLMTRMVTIITGSLRHCVCSRRCS